ncbi:alpha/beta hydrolase [Streptomyces sodiiphilus]|uniref:Alpha/beta hydrolase n=1 Tax=Streptomyces sodiiphilus TaxID=226217 RepID=A0ABP5A5L9_9ACTN
MPRRVPRVLTTVLLSLAAVAGTGGWADGTRTTVVTGPPPGAAAWLADTSTGTVPPDPADATPDEVAAFFAALSPRQRQELTERHPLTVGNLDGAPIALRYAANAESYTRHTGTPPTPGRQLLAFDPRGRGTLAEVFGDLSAARHTAVVVPGMDNDLARHGGPAGMARRLHREMTRDPGGAPAAVISWVGYTTPDGYGPDVATDRLAAAGAPRLVRLLTGLAVTTGSAPPTLVCHSYGSVVCGTAAPGLAPADAGDLVLLGSPGTGARDTAGLRTPARVWAARGPSDWIAHVPNVRLLGLGHGTDPASAGFGARLISADDAEGHSGYLDTGTDSLRNVAAIALNDHGAVVCAPHGQECADAH